VKALGFELRRFDAETDPPKGEYGSDGDSVSEKFVESLADVNDALTGYQKFDAFDEMVHTDSTANAVVWVPQLAIRSAQWRLDPASEDGDDRLVADALAWNFGLNDRDGYAAQSWPQSIDQAALCLRYGAFFEEKVWDDVTTWVDDEGGEHPIRPIQRLAPRKPRTIREVEWEKGRVSKITQNLMNVSPIPGHKLCHYQLKPEPGRWDGVSLLRAAWGPWTLKRELMIAAGIAWDRWAAGIPKVRYPKNGGQAALEKAEELGRAVRNHEHGYATFEGAPPDTANGGDGWDMEIMGGAGVLPDPTPLMIRYELAILGAGLMTWMALGTSSQTGARATAQVQDEPFYLFLEAFAGDIAEERSRQVFRQWVDVNFGRQYELPRLTVSKIQSEDVEKLARVVSELKLAGWDFGYPEVQNYVLALAHLPAPPEGFQPQPAEGSGLPPPPLPSSRRT
jgi:hypothetical protein